MERTRGFNFKLLVPPRVNKGQVSAVRPQEVVENCGGFMNPLEQGYSKYFDKEQSMCSVSASVVAPTKSTKQACQDFPKMKAVPPMEKNEINRHSGQLYTKLFDEVEKIKYWKIKANSDTVKKERKLQESKKTIETQRKAIQELQFGNESLSIKLEEEISVNDELRNKNNATRTLCNILKDTFEVSAEKMHSFESEREHTHHFLLENSERIEKLITEFQSLRIQTEVDQQEMQKVKEGLQQFEILKEKYNEEYDMKEKEVSVLQTTLKEKEKDLHKTLLDLSETQKHCRQLEDASGEQYGLLKSSETEKVSLLQKLQSVEQCLEDTDKKYEAIAAQLEESKAEYAEMIQSKDLSLLELSRVKTQQAEKLEQIQMANQNSLSLQIQRVKELEDELITNEEELERKSTLLGETVEQSAKKDGQIQILEEELDKKSKSVESMTVKIGITADRVKELEAELLNKKDEARLLKDEADVALAENNLLKKTCEAAEKEQEDLKEKSAVTKIKVQDLKQQLFSEVEKNKDHVSQMEQLRNDITHHEVKYTELLSNFNELQSEKKAIQQQFESGSSDVKAAEANIKVSEEKATKLTREIQRLEEENQSLREEVISTKTEIQGKYQETETLQKKSEEKCEHLQEEITGKEKEIKAGETKLYNLRKKFEIKLKANEEFQKENKVLKKQIAKEMAKSSELEVAISSIYEETQNLKQLNEEDHQKLLKDLESKSTSVAKLENEVQKLRLATTDAIKDKEDAGLKCQHKIADMVSLMEKHKSQYERMVEEKDAELDERKKRETEAVSQRKLLELDHSKNKAENDQLKQQLKTEVTEKANLQKELTDLKKELSSMKITQLSEARNKQSPALNCTQRKCSETPKESSAKRHMYDFAKSRKTPSNSKAVRRDGKESDTELMRTPCGKTPKTQDIQNGDLITLQSNRNQVGGSSKIKSYKVSTPPSTDKATRWGKSTVELDPKSESSDLNDLLTFVSAPASDLSAPPCKLNIFKKIQSPVPHKSPGNSLKLAAMKRMRDAGWTAVTGCDKKKKKTIEKIFA